MTSTSNDQRRALVVLGLPPLIAAVAGSPATAVAALAQPSTDALGTGPLLGALTLLTWALSGWLGLVVVISLSERLPGARGHAAGRVLTRLAPASVRALVRTATGVTVAGTLLLSGTAHADAARTDPAHRATASTGTPSSLDWPTAPSAAPSGPAAPMPTAAPLAPAARSAPAAAPAAPAVTRATSPDVVVVRAGDCLWDLAAHALGTDATPRQIASAWPSWWSANRAVIGDDPDLLRPGTSLAPPATLRRSPS